MKQCSKCKQEKPEDDFYLYKGKLRWQCKKCHTSNYANTNPEKRKETSKRYYDKQIKTNPAYYLWRNAKARAKQRNLEFSISPEDVVIPKTCPYLGTSLDRWDWMAPSIDRIDSSKGYTKDNIRVISRLANAMKNQATEEQLVSFAKGVLAMHTQGGTGPC